uniref:mucin-5AC-like isoform X9 n=1 Tax=Scatophagus argus TaxID=75038 RepID=UPI001ED830FD|nr:mucin-5AC-like isoform X9 [Scatophagus argus]
MLLPLLLLLVCSSQASHFYGTVMTYYPQNTDTTGSITVVLRYQLNFHLCSEGQAWSCFIGDCGNETSLVLNVVYQESGGEWCQREGIMTRQVPSNAPFQLILNFNFLIGNIVNGISSWSAVTLVELRNRSDTGQANRSPQTTILPAVRVPSNCRRDFSLLAFDPDGDEVRCRNGNAALSECYFCTPPSVLTLSSSCTLSFSPTSGSNEGLYAVQLVMEDFPRQSIILTQSNGSQEVKTTNNAISKIPVQFVLRVDPAVPSCTEGLYLPKFLPPTPVNGTRLYTPVNQTLEISIIAEANNSTISELLFSGPHNINRTTSGTGEFILRWTPSEDEDGESLPICFVVQATTSVKYHSELRCVIVTVGNGPTTTTTSPPTTTQQSTIITLDTTTTESTTDVSMVTTPVTTVTTPDDMTTQALDQTTTITTTSPPTMTQQSTIITPDTTTTERTTAVSTVTTPVTTVTTPDDMTTQALDQSTTITTTSLPTTTQQSTIITPDTTTTERTTAVSTMTPLVTTVTTPDDMTTPTQALSQSTTITTTSPPTTTQQSTIITPDTTTTESTTTVSTVTTPVTTVTTPDDMTTQALDQTTIITTTSLPTTTQQSTIITPDTTTTESTTAVSTVTTPVTTVTTPNDMTNATQDLNQIVLVLRVRISSLFPLTDEELRGTVIQQLKHELVRYGLPSDITVRLVSSIQLEPTNTATSAVVT